MVQSVLVEKQGGIATVTLNRPEALNAFNSQLRRDLAANLGDLNRDETVRGLVLTGSGNRAFSAGVDLKEAQHVQVADIEAWFGEMRDVYQAIRLLDKPLVVALNGISAGAGFQVALVSDIRVGHPGTRMGQPEINAGIPSVMGSFWMSLHLSLSLNLDLSLTGRLMDAEECQRVGLLNHLVPSGELMAKALSVAGELAAKPPTAMRRTKQRFREMTQPAFDEAYRAAVLGQQECYKNGEPQRAIADFIAKRGGSK
ncbi:MAG: enoyl-CoA hydratase/isomerase family protein [SAR324 cluster bacterium]|nr:enoyl-CoA hydratase/isomerase family protein [SAR324 cluster bacterium]